MGADGAAPATGEVRSSLAAALPLERAGLHPALTFVFFALPFVATALGYEGLRRITHLRGDVHVGDLYELEERLFPVTTSEGTRALSEVVANRPNAFLDLLTGATYLLFLVEVFGVATYLFFRARPKMLELSLGFLLANLVGWMIWLAYPAAPPWYVDLYGKGPAVLEAVSSPAGLTRIDALLPVPIAHAFYAKSANVFGAMPSLHVAYSVLVAFVVAPLGGALRWASLGFALSMAFSAVYLRHHYILDVIAGVLVALPVAYAARLATMRLAPSAEASA